MGLRMVPDENHPTKKKKVLTESGFLHGHRHCLGGLLHRLSQRIDLALVLRQFNSKSFFYCRPTSDCTFAFVFVVYLLIHVFAYLC